MHLRQEVRDQVPLQVPQRPPRGVQVRRPVQGAALRGLQDHLRQAVQEGESERKKERAAIAGKCRGNAKHCEEKLRVQKNTWLVASNTEKK